MIVFYSELFGREMIPSLWCICLTVSVGENSTGGNQHLLFFLPLVSLLQYINKNLIFTFSLAHRADYHYT